jgi:uncharacterized membrane protein
MERYWEIDFARGTAVIMMILSNFITDLQYFFNYDNYETFWWLFARSTAFIFIFIVGLSLTISYSKVKYNPKIYKKYIARGLKIFGLGLLITAITYFFIPSDFIIFGVLHLIGISIILTYPFLRFKKTITLTIGLIIITLGQFIKKSYLSSNYLLWLGLVSKNFSSIDFFPLLPWLGVVLLGICLGKILYPKGIRRFEIPNWDNKISTIGRYSLYIYLIHQPILLGALFLLM